MLDAAEADLQALADQVEALGTRPRARPAALNGADPAAGEAAIARATALVGDSSRGPASCATPWRRCRTSARRTAG